MLCPKCKEHKEPQFFSRSKFNTSGLRTYCKSCEKHATAVWRATRKEKDFLVKKAYYERNKQKIINQARERQKRRRHSDINFRILVNLRRRLNNAIRGNNKSKATLALLGTDIPNLMQHLEKLFLPGMSWDNYGKWHIDHIRPCKSFNMSDPDDQAVCFNYKNLQPLWAIDNLRKSASDPSSSTCPETTILFP